MISVIIPTYNRSRILTRAIKSVLMQDYTDIEIIVMDNCSSDDTEKIVSELSDKRIRYIKNEVNQGGPRNKRLGLDNINGEYFVVLDDDDYYIDEKFFTKAIKAFENNSISCVIANARFMSNEGVLQENKKIGLDGLIKNIEYCKDYVIKYARPVSNFTTIQKTSNLKEFKMYDLKSVEDINLITCAVLSGDIYSIKEDVGSYTIDVNSGSNNLRVDYIDCVFDGLEHCYKVLNENDREKFEHWFVQCFRDLCTYTARCKNIELKTIKHLSERLKASELGINKKHSVMIYKALIYNKLGKDYY